MKLACSSTAFGAVLRSGDLTQLEWIDLCARELAADGAVFDMRHFPRFDTDYLAQLKKMCADLGLTVAAVRDDAFFGPDSARMERAFETALALGAPLLTARMELADAVNWNVALERVGAATAHAKRWNVTLAVQNAPQTLAASVHDLKRVAKEADSAWLHYGLDLDAFEAADEPQTLMQKTVLVVRDVERSRNAVQPAQFRGFVVLDAGSESASSAMMRAAIANLRALDDRT